MLAPYIIAAADCLAELAAMRISAKSGECNGRSLLKRQILLIFAVAHPCNHHSTHSSPLQPMRLTSAGRFLAPSRSTTGESGSVSASHGQAAVGRGLPAKCHSQFASPPYPSMTLSRCACRIVQSSNRFSPGMTMLVSVQLAFASAS